MNLEEMTLEEKVDLLVKYQRSAIRWQRARMIFSLFLFFILVILPIILFAKLMQSIDIKGTFGKINQNLNSLNEATGSLNEMTELLNDVQSLTQ